MQDFHFVMKHNKAAPSLFLACAQGDHIGEAVLTCRKAGGKQETYLKVTFSDLLVSSYQTGGSASGDDIPMDQISMNFAKIKIETFGQDAKGAVKPGPKATYDLKQVSKV